MSAVERLSMQRLNRMFVHPEPSHNISELRQDPDHSKKYFAGRILLESFRKNDADEIYISIRS